jgi:gamma-glutamyltranspeptidase / glutathione hydrolase
MLIGLRGPFAELAGRRALEVGGAAADAVLTTALAQVVLSAGCSVSFAGIFSLVYYEAAADKVHSLHAGYKSFQEEASPLTIPWQPIASGRTVLVPGFFAGVEAVHRKFGKLPWKEIFEPAIYAAGKGSLVEPFLQENFEFRKDVLARTPEGHAIFFGQYGRLPVAGDRFQQPELARTLDTVARDGIDHIYRGEWAKRFVQQVRRDGGAATLEDLATYQPQWREPFRGDFNGYEVCTIAGSSVGGLNQIEGLHLAEEAHLGDPVSSGEALYWLVQICRQILYSNAPDHERVTRTHAQKLWQRMSEKGGMVGPMLAKQGRTPTTWSPSILRRTSPRSATQSTPRHGELLAFSW